jgi:hypothetical protein
MSIELPDLEATADVEIAADNIRAVGAIYSVWLLEQAAVFRVLDRIVELFQNGQLPLGQGHAGRALYRLWRSGDRMSAQERAAFYTQTLGVPGGEAGGETNQEFLSLWLRFLVAVSTYARQHGAAGLTVPPTTANAAVRAAARDLEANAAAHGRGSVPDTARRLQQEVSQMFAVLGEPELLQAFGARSVWQLIERVQQQELGGARNLARYRSQASAGSRIFDWLASLSDSAEATGTPRDDAALAEAVELLLAAMTAAAPAAEPGDLLAALGNKGAAGVAALFLGPSGTGKTLAAHVLASALRLPIFRIDLSRVVSKYIGETEKNLEVIFNRAEQQDAVLFFDEADVLFGRRTEVRDSHDRYANAAIDYLLQRLEAYEGALVIASDLQENIEAAFSREGAHRRWRVLRFPRPKG